MVSDFASLDLEPGEWREHVFMGGARSQDALGRVTRKLLRQRKTQYRDTCFETGG